MQEAIKKVQEKNNEVKNLQAKHLDKKAKLSELEAQSYLFGEEEIKKALGKEKVTQKDKEYFIQWKTLKAQRDVDNSYLEYKYAQEEFKILKMEFRAKYSQYDI